MSQAQYTIEDLERLSREIRDMREKVAELKKPYTDMQDELDAKEALAIGILKELGKKSYQGEAGTITRVESYRVNLPNSPEDKAAFRAFLEERGDFDRLLTYNSNTVNSYYMQEWENAKQSDDPTDALNFKIPGIQEPKIRETIQFRKGK